MTRERLSSDAGCLGALVSVAAVSLILTLAAFPPPASFGLYIPVFIVTTIVFAVIGLPLYLLAGHFRLENLWTAIACGAITGGSLPLIGAVSEGSRKAWLSAGAYALAGVIGGAAFFLAATAARNPARNVAILIALTGFAAALTPLIAALIR